MINTNANSNSNRNSNSEIIKKEDTATVNSHTILTLSDEQKNIILNLSDYALLEICCFGHIGKCHFKPCMYILKACINNSMCNNTI